MSGASGAYAQLAVERGLPFAGASAWLANLGVVRDRRGDAFLFLVFPDGIAAIEALGMASQGDGRRVLAITLVLFAVTPGRMRAGFADINSQLINPIGLPIAWREAVETITTVFGSIVFIGAIASTVSLIQRYRGAATEERQQIRWLPVARTCHGCIHLRASSSEVTETVGEDLGETLTSWGSSG